MKGHTFGVVRPVRIAKLQPGSRDDLRLKVLHLFDNDDLDGLALTVVVPNVSQVNARTSTLSWAGSQAQRFGVFRLEIGYLDGRGVFPIHIGNVEPSGVSGIVDVIQPVWELPGRSKATRFCQLTLQLADLRGFAPLRADLGVDRFRHKACNAEDGGSINCFDGGRLLYTEIMKNQSESPAHAFY